jgi:hypothetical protein
MSERPEASSVASEDWLPVLEQLLDGCNHTLNNRIAALGGISQLLGMDLVSRAEAGRAIGAEVELLRAATELLRKLGVQRPGRREAGRAGDALRLAAQLLAHHREARSYRFGIAEEPPDVEPLLLWRADHVRAAVLFLLAAGGEAKGELSIEARIEAADGLVRISATTPVASGVVQGTRSYGALARFAAAEGGACTSAAAPDGATALVLELPGLARASARHAEP